MPHLGTDRSQGIALTAAASLFWATSFTATGIGLRYANPFLLVFLRFAVAAVAVGLVLLFTRRTAAVREQIRSRQVWGLGILYSIAFLLQYLGQALTTAAAATVLSNLFPILVPPLAFALLRERAGAAQAAALAIGILGLVMFALPDAGAGRDDLVGDLLLFGSALGYAFFIIGSKRWLRGDPLDSSLAITLLLALMLLPAAVFPGGISSSVLSLPLDLWLAVAWMGVMCSVIPLALYLRGLAKIPASLSGMLLLMELLFGVALASALLSDSLGGWELAGAATVCAAVVLASVKSRRSGGESRSSGPDAKATRASPAASPDD